MRLQPTRKLARVDSKRMVVSLCDHNYEQDRTAHKAVNFLSLIANATLTVAAISFKRRHITTDTHM